MMTHGELDRAIRELLDLHLNLEDGEMVMPLKSIEIPCLHQAIRDLVDRAVSEVER